jgi:glycosyltransferase involved in cell wall biosynthesis
MIFRSKPRLSVITIFTDEAPAFYTLDSLLTQSVLPFEIIAVPARPVSETYKVRYANIGIIKTLPPSNLGIYPAFNAGLSAVTGDFYFHLNGGDVLLAETSLSEVTSAIENLPPEDFGMSLLSFGYLLAWRGELYEPRDTSTRCHESIVFPRIKGIEYDPRYRIYGDAPFIENMYRRTKYRIHSSIPIMIFSHGGVSNTAFNVHDLFLLLTHRCYVLVIKLILRRLFVRLLGESLGSRLLIFRRYRRLS